MSTNKALVHQFAIAAGLPSAGVRTVLRDASGRPLSWQENGFALTAAYYAADRSAVITLSRGPERSVHKVYYDASGNVLRTEGLAIPTAMLAEIVAGEVAVDTSVVTETSGARQVEELQVTVSPPGPSTLQQHSFSVRTRYESAQPMGVGGWVVSYKGENQVVSSQPVDKSVVYAAYTVAAGGVVLDKSLGFEAVVAGLDGISSINQYAGFYSANLEAVPGIERINVAYAFANDWWRASIKNVGRYLKAKDRATGGVLQEVAPAESPGLAAGRYYGPWGAGGSYAPAALQPGFIYAVPFFVPERTTFTKIGCRVVAGAAGASLRLGIYHAAGGVPAALVVDGGALSAAAAGSVEATISATLEAGMYFLAAASSSASVTINWASVAGLRSIMGSTTDNGSETTPLMAQAFGALPAAFVTGGFFDTGATVPNVWLRV